jgi:hypothetical protein
VSRIHLPRTKIGAAARWAVFPRWSEVAMLEVSVPADGSQTLGRIARHGRQSIASNAAFSARRYPSAAAVGIFHHQI